MCKKSNWFVYIFAGLYIVEVVLVLLHYSPFMKWQDLPLEGSNDRFNWLDVEDKKGVHWS